jgi:hypothetical protein
MMLVSHALSVDLLQFGPLNTGITWNALSTEAVRGYFAPSNLPLGKKITATSCLSSVNSYTLQYPAVQ